MKIEFQEYQPKKIVNVQKKVDSWYWTKYSAHPYIGCRSGCDFCYLRGETYLGWRDPASFDTLIRVKSNAEDLLKTELTKLSPDVIACGDWQQPAEDRYQLSRRMLEIVMEKEFPLFIVERSPLVARDLDLLVEINQRTWVGVVISISNLDPALKLAFEPRSPGVKRRLILMRQLAEAGILVGVSLMPVIPFVGDSDHRIAEVILATKDHGGSFVLAGGLTMAGTQAAFTLAAARRYEPDPTLEANIRNLYGWQEGKKPAYSPPASYHVRLGNRVRELCTKHNLHDRMPRYIPSSALGINKLIAERLFLKMYDLELANAPGYKVWAYRKAAWTVDEWAESLKEVYQQRGEEGLMALPEVGKGIAKEIVRWLEGAISQEK